MVLAWILLLAASTGVELVDSFYQIPADDWRHIPIALNQKPALVSARFEVQSGPHQVRIALMRKDDLDRFREGMPQNVIDATGSAGGGELKPHIRGLGDYEIVVKNDGGAAATVHLQVHLDFAVGQATEVTRLSPRRQLAVVAISFAVFFGVVGWSARRLLRGFRQ